MFSLKTHLNLPSDRCNTSQNTWLTCSFLPFSDGRGKPCDHQKVSKNLACRRQVFRLMECLTSMYELVVYMYVQSPGTLEMQWFLA